MKSTEKARKDAMTVLINEISYGNLIFTEDTVAAIEEITPGIISTLEHTKEMKYETVLEYIFIAIQKILRKNRIIMDYLKDQNK